MTSHGRDTVRGATDGPRVYLFYTRQELSVYSKSFLCLRRYSLDARGRGVSIWRLRGGGTFIQCRGLGVDVDVRTGPGREHMGCLGVIGTNLQNKERGSRRISRGRLQELVKTRLDH